MTPLLHSQADNTKPVNASVAATNGPSGSSARIPLVVPTDELFFWTNDWQFGERQSEKARNEGKSVVFDDPEDVLRWLHEVDG